MDSIHHPNERHWISKPVQIGDYFTQLKNKVKTIKPPLQRTEDMSDKIMMKMIGMEDKELFDKLEDVMKLENLSSVKEVEPMQINDTILDNKKRRPDIAKFYKTDISSSARRSLKTLCLQDAWLEGTDIKIHNNKYKQRRIRQSKFDNDNWFTSEKVPDQKMNPHLVDEAVVFVVRIYRPFRSRTLLPCYSYYNQVRYVQEILLLGHHTLADLRDKILCPVDRFAVGAQQVDTIVKPATTAGQVYKSGFFYIEGTFYNDLRDPDSIDYSEIIRDWASIKGLGPFSTARLEEQRLDGLTMRLGYPYLYQHQGNHEHIVSFIDVRLLGRNDPQSANEYPMVRSLGTQVPKYCNVCNFQVASWVCINHTRVPQDPYFFCKSCYKKFNFVDSVRVGSFNALRFYDAAVIY